jgi:hypothetical protein
MDILWVQLKQQRLVPQTISYVMANGEQDAQGESNERCAR